MGVEWKASAMRQLSDIFERPGMTPIDWDFLAGEVEYVRGELASNPLSLGDGQEAGRRVWDTGVLAVTFQVLNDDDVVITSVVAPPRRGG